MNTHPEQWAAIYAAAPRGQLGVRYLAQGHLSRGIEGGESAVHSLPPPTIPAGLRLEPAMSNLLKQVYQLLGIKSLRTTPYHPQTDGLTERFNQTLKQMLRKFVDETGRDWDQWLPYLLFAYREVPQASTGFSPFELLYGHEVRGPLTILKEVWEGDCGKSEPTNIVSFVLQMRERLEKMRALAQTHLAEAQRHQKTWYDQLARERGFDVGEKLLVMLPSQENKLLAKWQGPFEIKNQLGPTTYEVATPGQDRASRILHVNLLKKWVS